MVIIIKFKNKKLIYFILIMKYIYKYYYCYSINGFKNIFKNIFKSIYNRYIYLFLLNNYYILL